MFINSMVENFLNQALGLPDKEADTKAYIACAVRPKRSHEQLLVFEARSQRPSQDLEDEHVSNVRSFNSSTCNMVKRMEGIIFPKGEFATSLYYQELLTFEEVYQFGVRQGIIAGS